MSLTHRTPRGHYYFTDGTDPSLIVRAVRTHDDVVPAGNSVAALNLLRLSDLLLDPEAARRAQALFSPRRLGTWHGIRRASRCS